MNPCFLHTLISTFFFLFSACCWKGSQCRIFINVSSTVWGKHTPTCCAISFWSSCHSNSRLCNVPISPDRSCCFAICDVQLCNVPSCWTAGNSNQSGGCWCCTSPGCSVSVQQPASAAVCAAWYWRPFQEHASGCLFQGCEWLWCVSDVVHGLYTFVTISAFFYHGGACREARSQLGNILGLKQIRRIFEYLNHWLIRRNLFVWFVANTKLCMITHNIHIRMVR